MATTATRLTPTGAHGGVRSQKIGRVAVAREVTGGDGGVTAFHDGGGRVLQHAQIVLIFWGNAWNQASTTPSRTDFTNALTGIVQGPWGTQLAQYRGIGPMSISGVVTIT